MARGIESRVERLERQTPPVSDEAERRWRAFLHRLPTEHLLLLLIDVDRALLAHPDLPPEQRPEIEADIGRREGEIAAMRRFWSQPDVLAAVEANMAAGDVPCGWRSPLEGYERDTLLVEGLVVARALSAGPAQAGLN